MELHVHVSGKHHFQKFSNVYETALFGDSVNTTAANIFISSAKFMCHLHMMRISFLS